MNSAESNPHGGWVSALLKLILCAMSYLAAIEVATPLGLETRPPIPQGSPKRQPWALRLIEHYPNVEHFTIQFNTQLNGSKGFPVLLTGLAWNRETHCTR